MSQFGCHDAIEKIYLLARLLANVALHGMEEALGVTYGWGNTLRSKRALVRYADDFVVFCESQEDADTARQILTEWLGKRGLVLSPEKTSIVHLTEGFDFLGYNIRLYQAPKTSRTGYKLLIKPSKQSGMKIRKKLRARWRKLRGSNARAIARALNPIIRGWANYFRVKVAKETFNALDNWMFQQEVRYARRTHPNKPWKWLKGRYWGKLNPKRNDAWVFGDNAQQTYLLKFSWFKIERHVMVKGKASPDDPALQEYWQKRQQAKTASAEYVVSASSMEKICTNITYNQEARVERTIEQIAHWYTCTVTNKFTVAEREALSQKSF